MNVPPVANPPAASRPAIASVQPEETALSRDGSAAVSSALASEPSVRPEAMARARALLADPAYPSMDTLRQIAGALLSGPTLDGTDRDA
jgi:hypothetical protein